MHIVYSLFLFISPSVLVYCIFLYVCIFSFDASILANKDVYNYIVKLVHRIRQWPSTCCWWQCCYLAEGPGDKKMKIHFAPFISVGSECRWLSVPSAKSRGQMAWYSSGINGNTCKQLGRARYVSSFPAIYTLCLEKTVPLYIRL